MEIATFTCKNCGANVRTPDSPGPVTCTYCGSSHRVSFQDGSVITELIEKVKRLDDVVARIKGGQVPRRGAPSLKERLDMIGEGKQKWHEYFSSVKAGKPKDSPDMLAVFSQAQANLIGGYGPGTGLLIEDAYGAKLIGVDPPAGYSCLYMLLAVIILSAVVGAVTLLGGEKTTGVMLLGIGLVGLVAGIPFVVVGIRTDKLDIAKRKEALRQLDDIERKIRRRLAAEKPR